MNGFFAPLPLLLMVWLFPDYVNNSNLLPLIGIPLLWLVAYPCLLRHHWRLDVIRVQILYGFTHSVAILAMFAGTQADRVPSDDVVNGPTALPVNAKPITAEYLT